MKPSPADLHEMEDIEPFAKAVTDTGYMSVIATLNDLHPNAPHDQNHGTTIQPHECEMRTILDIIARRKQATDLLMSVLEGLHAAHDLGHKPKAWPKACLGCQMYKAVEDTRYQR